MPRLTTIFKNVPQEKTFWCWAAVASNAFNSLLAAGASAKSQCDVVKMVQGDCDGNDTDGLGLALGKLGIQDRNSSTPTFALLEFELSERPGPDPVCAVIEFSGNAVHYVAVSSVDTGPPEMVWVEDPFLGPPAIEFTYEDFINNYRYQQPVGPGPSPSGVVKGFYRVKRTGGM